MKIRAATWLDAMKISELWDKMHKEIAPRCSMYEENANLKNFYLKLLVRLESQEWRVLVAEKDKKIIGFMMSFVRWPLYNPCHIIGTVEALYVEPEYRGNGIHKKLIDDSIAWGVSNGMKEMEFVSTYDSKMIRFYDNLGYEPVQLVYRQKEV